MNHYSISVTIALCLLLLAGNTQAQLDIANTKHDASQPIDIVSERLTLHPNKNMAIFNGDVKAQQGTFHMTSQKMVVHYHGNEEKDRGGVSKIITEGGVELMVPGKNAKASQGIYDVDASMVTLTGDVVLQRGANTLYGDKFTYDVNKGLSRLTSEPESSATTSKSSGKKITQTKKKGRVKAFLVPKKPKKK